LTLRYYTTNTAMKESKFIELLNLYVDHHISPDDAALLEAEVRTNPEHRRVYRQYCQIQKACTELGEAFRSDSPAPAAASKTVDFNPRGRRFTAAKTLTGFAAIAACVATALVVRSRLAVPADVPPPADTVAVAIPVADIPTPHVVTVRPALQPAIGPRSFALRDQNSELPEASAAEQVGFGDWMNDVRLSSMGAVSLDDLRFDGKAPLRNDVRTYQTMRPFQGKVEMTAFKFQR
jgi:hypothetical protein